MYVITALLLHALCPKFECKDVENEGCGNVLRQPQTQEDVPMNRNDSYATQHTYEIVG